MRRGLELVKDFVVQLPTAVDPNRYNGGNGGGGMDNTYCEASCCVNGAPAEPEECMRMFIIVGSVIGGTIVVCVCVPICICLFWKVCGKSGQRKERAGWGQNPDGSWSHGAAGSGGVSVGATAYKQRGPTPAEATAQAVAVEPASPRRSRSWAEVASGAPQVVIAEAVPM